MLTESSAEALLAPLAEEEALLLAVSGGPDSVALMLLAARWSLRRAKRIEVATVDHGLRAGSDEEARQVAAWAGALGFAHHVLRWEGAKPQTRIQERARDARYALLGACALQIAPNCPIVTAHHADDQAETILFRLTRGSGVAGLAGMAQSARLGGARLLRPLLGVAKARLEAMCRDAAHPFLLDPSNRNEAFARARLRALSETLSRQGLNADALLRLGARARRAEEALRFSAERAGEAALLERDGDRSIFDSAALRILPEEFLLRVLAADIARRGLTAPRFERLERTSAIVGARLRSRTAGRITLAGLAIRIDDRETTLTPAPPRRAVRAKALQLEKHPQ